MGVRRVGRGGGSKARRRARPVVKFEYGGWRKERERNLCGVGLKLLVCSDKFESGIVMHADTPQTGFKTFINNVLGMK